jgi:Terminase large subunit, T4likevirus-type, N-terminal/Terminase RNaseH-like domain
VTTLNRPQAQFLALPHKFRAFVAGYGSGKTWVGGGALCKHALEWPRINAGYFAPTYPHIRDIFFPTIEEVAADWGLRVEIREANKEIHVYRGRQYRTTIICRSMERPGDIIGFKIGRALIDEIDVMKKAKAFIAWRKIIARMRQKAAGLINGVDVTTTPEGFGFTYDQFVKQVREKPALGDMYGMVQASTYDNGQNLPDDYIPSLKASYPPQLIQAYLDGQFVNLASGAVYPDFSRILNHTNERIKPGEALHIGMDFNVLNMTAVVSVIRDGLPLTLAELTKVRDTPAMARLLKERYAGHAIAVYPDASGQNTSSKDASESDLSILRAAGLTVIVNSANPAVRDRVNSVCAMIQNAEGARRWLINTDACPSLTECIEQQAYDNNGEPDKAGGLDHAPDAVGYFLAKRWPIVKRTAFIEPLRI